MSLKRNVDDGDSPLIAETTHTRKRNRYISIACNECKRRKIKCNGNTPCQRCRNLGLECQYAPNCTNGFKESDEFRQMNAHVIALQGQVNDLFARFDALGRSGNTPAGDGISLPPPPSDHSIMVDMAHLSSQAIQSPLPPGAQRPPLQRSSRPTSFRGPTSSVYHLNVAKETLHKMGYETVNDADEGLPIHRRPLTTPSTVQRPPSENASEHPIWDPIWSLRIEEIIRLCRVFEEEMGDLCPVVNMEQTILHATNIYKNVDTAMSAGLEKSTGPGQGLNDRLSNVLKMVVASAMTAESNGDSDLGRRLFESVKGKAYEALHNETIDVDEFPFLILVTIYHYHCDEENLAWRINGQIARMCLELGLHRRESIDNIADVGERNQIIRIFWSIYVLDRRWSFATGMPLALQDADIEPNLPQPETDFRYLNVMIAFAKLASRLWCQLNSFDITPFSFNTLEMSSYNSLFLQWQRSIPPDLQLPPASAPQTPSRLQYRLQILLYLRANQGRILVYRPVLHSASSIQDNMGNATTVVEIAKDSIRALSHLNQTTNIYRRHQVCFNYFLVSAIAVIFLATCHAPVHFSTICRDEFYVALDLVKNFSDRSLVSKRLWRAIKDLKEIGPKLGLDPSTKKITDEAENAQSHTALAMAGLPRRRDGLATPNDGFQLRNEMTNLFEAALDSVGQSDPYMGLNAAQERPMSLSYSGGMACGTGHVYRPV